VAALADVAVVAVAAEADLVPVVDVALRVADKVGAVARGAKVAHAAVAVAAVDVARAKAETVTADAEMVEASSSRT
jgi:hypothetical protein